MRPWVVFTAVPVCCDRGVHVLLRVGGDSPESCVAPASSVVDPPLDELPLLDPPLEDEPPLDGPPLDEPLLESPPDELPDGGD
jgi:hypothetical protein